MSPPAIYVEEEQEQLEAEDDVVDAEQCMVLVLIPLLLL
jgi:hypothetical protein